jgi:hypothetical protein
MKKLFTLITILLLYATVTNAQSKTPAKVDTIKKTDSIKVNTSTDKTEKFKKNDSAFKKLNLVRTGDINEVDSLDLTLKSCMFEPLANAMVLQDLGLFTFSGNRIGMTRYKRLKIFNDNGKSEANIRIEYNNRFGTEHILAIVAQTINMVNGKIVRTKLDSTLIYNQHTDKQKDAIIFTMPNVKAGSVIEYAYAWIRDASWNLPDWDFQNKLPTKYSEAYVVLNPFLSLTRLTYTDQPFKKDTSMAGFGHVWSMENIPSSKEEPFMRSANDALQRVCFIVKSSMNYNGTMHNIADSWATIGNQLIQEKGFYKPFEQNISDADDIIKKTKALTTDDEKIEYLFNQVRALMNINDNTNWVSKDGIKSAWKRKIGSPAEINMILCHLLKQSGIKAYPLLVSTRDNGLIYTNFPNVYQINKLVTYIPVDSTKNYVLDASDKYNLYNEIPFELLNSTGLCINKEKNSSYMVIMEKKDPVRKRVAIEAEIKTDATISGTAEISSDSYDKSSSIELHNTLDEKKYEEYLTNSDNNLKITSLKFENAEVDSLPLVQTINFKLDLSATDDNYIYFSPNLFTALHYNPFLSDTRATDIDFGFKNIESISARYKIPGGYKTYILPKNLSLVTSDKNITFKRIVTEEDGYIIVYYIINYKQSIYSKDDYSSLFAFYKKMYEMLNEQIVLKKS